MSNDSKNGVCGRNKPPKWSSEELNMIEEIFRLKTLDDKNRLFTDKFVDELKKAIKKTTDQGNCGYAVTMFFRSKSALNLVIGNNDGENKYFLLRAKFKSGKIIKYDTREHWMPINWVVMKMVSYLMNKDINNEIIDKGWLMK